MPICGEDNRLKGMLTDRDIVVKALAQGKDPATGGSPTLALQKIFEDLVLRQFSNAMRLRQKVSDGDFDKLKQACEEWPSKKNGWEKPRPEEMSFIWRTKVCAKPAPAYHSSINVRMAEAAIDALLSDAAAGPELADDTLKNAFLSKAQLWLDSGAMGMARIRSSSAITWIR